MSTKFGAAVRWNERSYRRTKVQLGATSLSRQQTHHSKSLSVSRFRRFPTTPKNIFGEHQIFATYFSLIYSD